MASLQFRSDHRIMKRQKEELKHEARVGAEVDQFKVLQKSLWENQMNGVIRQNRVKTKVANMQSQLSAQLQERRHMLADKLSAEMRSWERQMVEAEDTPQQRMDKMAVRAYDLKKRREDERKKLVQEKLYQQWRSGIDDLRTMDTQIVELKCIVDRDFQLDEKAIQQAEEKAHDDFYANLWHDGYLAKIEREEREKEMKKERNDQTKKTLGVQLEMKHARVQEEKQAEDAEAVEMKKFWAAQEQEQKDALVRGVVKAKEDRKKTDEFMAIQQAQRAEEERIEKELDKNFVNGVLERERRVAEMEAEQKSQAKKKAVEFTEALKVEMARKAESDAELVRLQAEETERQWAKRYAGWEKEERARRNLMEEVYKDRAEQVHVKAQMRENLKSGLDQERQNILDENARLEAVDREREEGEKLVAKRHQEELFRQMDFHQVQRHRQLQQHAIEQRQAAIQEEKIRRAVAAEKATSSRIMNEIRDKRSTQRPHASVTAPWDR